jgi:hypothetical protein
MSFAALYDHITHLDAVLTGKSMSEVAHNARHQAHLFQDMVEFVAYRHCYYLSDSGYSRVFVTDEGEIFLTSNSRDAVKAMWETPEAIEAAESFRTAVMALVDEADRTHGEGSSTAP